MFINNKKYTAAMLLVLLGMFFYPAKILYACGGKDVTLSDLSSGPYTSRAFRYDEKGTLIADRSLINISPDTAQSIAERYLIENFSDPPLPLAFRKLERVHRKLVYQFQSEPVPGYDGQYHLGPVNFKVERLILDVDALTGNLHIANGCGAAPGRLVYRYNPLDFDETGDFLSIPLISNNTNFIARNTGNPIKIDGRIGPDEWKDTGHRYFYLGTYQEHNPSKEHQEAYYYAEVWTQIDDKNIYFAVKTDTPYWLALMFKDNPNLGMLGAYKDAKVMKSDGEISDRYFTSRPDKTFFLEKDKKEHILSVGTHQNDFYTYEFAFPLETNDSEDVSFETGKAYNMLLVVGNTTEHFGIFTLDKAHANHDHSKNNKEHVDVWASNETTFRIGTPPEKDIFGNPVQPVFAGFDSGFDSSKNNNHFHYVGVSLKDFKDRAPFSRFAGWLVTGLGFIGAATVMIRFRSNRVKQQTTHDNSGFDLLRINWVRRFVLWKYFRHVFIVPTLMIFLAIISLGFFDIQDGQRNIATVYTWTLWWSLVIFTFIVAGRFWCMMCPFAFLGDLAQKIISFNRKLPRPLQNMWFQTFAFILLTWAFTIMAFSSKPFVTAVVIAVILIAAIVFSIVYQRRSFCRNICPIGAVIGIYSMVSPIELRSCREERCENHKQKTCGDACPMLESPYEMDNNIYCNFCMKCQPACKTDNLGLRIRTFGKDIYASIRKSPTEAIAALFLLGVVIVETLAMTSSWKPLENSLGTLLGINSQVVIYTTIFTLIILVPVGVFYLICYLLRLWLGREKYRTQGLVTDLAFLFIPLGIALHFAHNIQHLLLESPVAVPATLRFFQNLGIATALSPNWNPLPVMGLGPIFFIQIGIIAAGFIFTFFIMYRLLRRFQKPINHIYKMAIVMSLYALVIVLSSIYMLGLPMGGRHVH
jgi:polyferredoxin